MASTDRNRDLGYCLFVGGFAFLKFSPFLFDLINPVVLVALLFPISVMMMMVGMILVARGKLATRH
jgi:hypothetical protein